MGKRPVFGQSMQDYLSRLSGEFVVGFEDCVHGFVCLNYDQGRAGLGCTRGCWEMSLFGVAVTTELSVHVS